MLEKKSNGGRKKGSSNNLTTKVKEILFLATKGNYQRIGKEIKRMEAEKKPPLLAKLLPYLLSKAKNPEEQELQDILYQELKPHYKKFGSYLNHYPKEKMANFLISNLAKLIPKSKTEEIVDIVSKKIKRRY